MDAQDNFLKLDILDIESKLRELLFSKHPLKLWKNSDTCEKLSVLSVENNKIKVENFEIQNSEEIYFANFRLRGMDYYFRCSVEIDGSSIFLNAASEVYRAERRRNLRILIHPKMTGYIYFTFQTEEEEEVTNVLSFNKARNEEKKLFKEFQNELKLEARISGSKLLDISENGLSFVVTNKDYNLIKSTTPKDATLIIGDKSLPISNIDYIYDLDYLDHRLEGIGFKKFGVKFDQTEKSKNLVESLNDESLVLTSLDEEFTKFISNIKE